VEREGAQASVFIVTLLHDQRYVIIVSRCHHHRHLQTQHFRTIFQLHLLFRYFLQFLNANAISSKLEKVAEEQMKLENSAEVLCLQMSVVMTPTDDDYVALVM
jgi:hypothetical protein